MSVHTRAGTNALLGCWEGDYASTIQDLWISKPILFIGSNKDDWAKGLTRDDFELLCTNGKRANTMDYKTCHLAKVPTHAVVARPEKANKIRELLEGQEVSGTDSGRNVLGWFFTQHIYIFRAMMLSKWVKCGRFWLTDMGSEPCPLVSPSLHPFWTYSCVLETPLGCLISDPAVSGTR